MHLYHDVRLKSPLQSFGKIQRRVRQLKSVAGLQEALRFALTEEDGGEIRIRLIASGRTVTLRSGTTDVMCFEKVFLGEEYKTPFPTEPRLIVDAGANIGMATLYYSCTYPKARIIAIEPELSNFKILEKNCGDLPNVTLVNGALWYEERNLTLGNPNADKWAFSVEEITPGSSSGASEVPALTIPGILKRFGADCIDILKLDIEGAEHELFRNGTDAWLDAVGQIVIELHDRFRPGCSQGFYAAVGRKPFAQECRGECIFVRFEQTNAAVLK